MKEIKLSPSTWVQRGIGKDFIPSRIGKNLLNKNKIKYARDKR